MQVVGQIGIGHHEQNKNLAYNRKQYLIRDAIQ